MGWNDVAYWQAMGWGAIAAVIGIRLLVRAAQEHSLVWTVVCGVLAVVGAITIAGSTAGIIV